jgi:hypothetical protein
MAHGRYRTVKPEHWGDRHLPEISRSAHLTWIGTWNFSDDKGVIENDPHWIRSQIYPRRTDVDLKDIENEITELITAGFMISFEYKGIKYLITRTFNLHQKIDKPRPSKIPDQLINRLRADSSADDKEPAKRRRDSSPKGSEKSPCSVEYGNSSVPEGNKGPNGPGAADATPDELVKLYKGLDKTGKAVAEFIEQHRPKFLEPYFDAWNIFARANKFPEVKEPTPSRRKKLAVRLGEKTFDFLGILKKAKASEFIRTGTFFSYLTIKITSRSWREITTVRPRTKRHPAPATSPRSRPVLMLISYISSSDPKRPQSIRGRLTQRFMTTWFPGPNSP